MKYFFSLLLTFLLFGCQQTPVEPAPPTTDELVASYITELEQVLQTIRIGETTTEALADYVQLDDTQYEQPPIRITTKDGLVEAVTLTLSTPLTLEDEAQMDKYGPYNARWLTEADLVTALQFTRTTPTLQQQIAAMPLEKRIGQLILTGFDGTTVTPLLQQAIVDAQIGHVILFSKNITTTKQLTALNKNLLQLNPALWITVDEEGGRVSRIPDGLLTLPTATHIAKKYTLEQTTALAHLQGELLRALGFSVNFAPVFDVNSNPKNPVIGDRAFSRDVQLVSNYGNAFASGLKKAGILAVGKHFPGHGDTITDSHLALPVIQKTKAQLQTNELVPFQQAINGGIEMLMMGHLLIPALDAQQPASLSPAIMQQLLREEMGFNGVIITDDLTMQAVGSSASEAAVNAILAGADIALIGHGTEQAIAATKALKGAVAAGRLTEHELNARVYRILSLKERYSGHVNEAFDFTEWNKKIRTQLHNNS